MKKTIKVDKIEQDVDDLLAQLPVKQVLTNIEEVFSHPLNPRKGDVTEIKSSIKENGYYPSIFIQKSTNFVIKGNHTHKALRELNANDRKFKGKFKQVLMNWVEVDDQQALRILLRDNRTSDNSGYDTEVLYKALKEVDEISQTGLYGTGFDEHIIDSLERQIGINVDIVDMTKDERQKVINEETGRETISKDDVPDAIFPSDNEWDVPNLLLSHQADFADLPVLAWGSQRGRKGKTNVGTYHFYTTDSHIEPLWKNPSHVVNTVVKCVTELNFTVYPDTPKAVALWHTYRKRWLSRYFQSYNIKIFVDINVNEGFYDMNFIGVPDGWKAYSTRGYAMNIENGAMDREIDLARQKAKTKDILLLVVGGAKSVQSYCKKHGFIWIPDEMAVARGAADDVINTMNKRG